MTLFDPARDEFRPVGQMKNPRWYPGMVSLSDGRVMIASGARRLAQTWQNPEPSFSQVRETEIYDPRTESWQAAGKDALSLPLYPRMTEADVWDVIRAVRSIVERHRVGREV